jgi:hypothetical protein
VALAAFAVLGALAVVWPSDLIRVRAGRHAVGRWFDSFPAH